MAYVIERGLGHCFTPEARVVGASKLSLRETLSAPTSWLPVGAHNRLMLSLDHEAVS